MPFHNSRLRLLSLGRPSRLLRPALLLSLAMVALLASCHRASSPGSGDVLYVAVPKAILRDRVAVVYNKVATVKNGDRLEVLERQPRFARVRTAQNVKGWIALRCLVSANVYEQFRQLGVLNRDTPVQSHGVTRFAANMHVAPGRAAPVLYQLPANAKVELLKRATSERATREEIAAAKADEIAILSGEHPEPEPHQPSRTPASSSAAAGASSARAAKPRPMDDWWLARDAEGHTGWILAELIYADIPLDVAQYAEGQRIQAAFVLDSENDSVKGKKNEYLCLMNRNRNGIPYDFDEIRVFTWNLKKHRYETAYRRRHIVGYFPATVSTENFGKEGTMPVFTVRLQNVDGTITPRKYRLIGNVVRPVPAAGESHPKAATAPDELQKSPAKARSRRRRRARPWW